MNAFLESVVRRRVTVIMVALASCVFGWVGYSRLSLELFPDISYPSLTVQTEMPDTAPQEIEYLISRPVEEAVGVLRGLTSVRSVSRADVSEVTLEFAWGSDMDLLSMEVRDKLDRLILPSEAEDPIVLRFDPALDPVVRLALSGDDDLTAQRLLAEQKLKLDLETIPGVAAAQVKGGLEEEVHVDVDQERLAALGIAMDRIRQLVGVSNLNLPGGALRGETSQYLVRTVNEFESVDDIGELIVRQDESAVVRLKDVAKVELGHKEREELMRVNGAEAIEIDIFKEGDANTVQVAKELRRRVDEWQTKLPAGQRLQVLFDQSRFIENAVREVRSSAVIGGILAIFVLMFFLRDLRSTLIIATSIPLSVIVTFMVMYRTGISLNIMSLGGLTLGIGMLVDNSIVVLESVFRKREQGLGLREAATRGTAEMAPAVIASTLTTVAVFLPIVFVEGVAGQLFRDQALTVTISLLASLLVSITVIPMFAAWGRPTAAVAAKPSAARVESRLAAGYDRVLRAALARRWLTLGMAALLFGLSIGSVRWLDTELIPALSEGEFHFEAKLPEGSSLVATDRVLEQMEQSAAAQPEIASHYVTVGSRLASGGMSLQTKAENLGMLYVVLENRTEDDAVEATANALRAAFAGIPDLELNFGRPSYFNLRTPIEVVLYGEDLEELRALSLELAQQLSFISGVVDVRSSLEAGSPELRVHFDRERLAALGLDMGSMSETLRQRVQGVVPTRFKREDRQIDVRIRNQEEDRASFADVRNLVLTGANGESLRLLSVADVNVDRGPAEIHRLQQQRAAVVSANLNGRSLGAVEAEIRAVADAIVGSGSYELAGQSKEMQQSFASLRFAIGLAIFLVYLVMAATFESFVHPFVVLFTIPLALVGVVAGLLATQTPISVVALIGVVVLVGIVVNNAIVLIDTVRRLREQGMPREEAIVHAGHLRMRPILMTTLTTVLGLVPMALPFGEGSELRTPLAITVLSGLSIATLLTLVVIPAVYLSIPERQRERS